MSITAPVAAPEVDPLIMRIICHTKMRHLQVSARGKGPCRRRLQNINRLQLISDFIFLKKMSKLNRDILYLIFEEFQSDNRTLHSCLLINRTWCEIIILILWKNPCKYLMKGRERLLLSVILSHLSHEIKDNLRSQGINFSYQ